MRRRNLLTSNNGGFTPDPATGRGMIGDYEAVDLGLPSGTLWATWNVGATTELEDGNYYMYGKGNNTYQTTSGQSSYSGTENPLAASADTATQAMGSDWHMPTKEQLQELIDNTDKSFDFGSKVVLFKNKVNPNIYLAIKASSYYENGKNSTSGSSANIWCSTPGSDATKAYRLNTLFALNVYGVGEASRDNGCTVRGVHTKIE